MPARSSKAIRAQNYRGVFVFVTTLYQRKTRHTTDVLDLQFRFGTLFSRNGRPSNRRRIGCRGCASESNRKTARGKGTAHAAERKERSLEPIKP